MSKGLLISIEGPDGAGKTSVLKVLLPRLREVYPAPGHNGHVSRVAWLLQSKSVKLFWI